MGTSSFRLIASSSRSPRVGSGLARCERPGRRPRQRSRSGSVVSPSRSSRMRARRSARGVLRVDVLGHRVRDPAGRGRVCLARVGTPGDGGQPRTGSGWTLAESFVDGHPTPVGRSPRQRTLSVFAGSDRRAGGGTLRAIPTWKKHPSAWPVTTFVLGSVRRTRRASCWRSEGAALGRGRESAPGASADCAKLSVANGSDPTTIGTTVADADRLLTMFGDKSPTVSPSSVLVGRWSAMASCSAATTGAADPYVRPIFSLGLRPRSDHLEARPFPVSALQSRHASSREACRASRRQIRCDVSHGVGVTSRTVHPSASQPDDLLRSPRRHGERAERVAWCGRAACPFSSTASRSMAIRGEMFFSVFTPSALHRLF